MNKNALAISGVTAVILVVLVGLQLSNQPQIALKPNDRMTTPQAATNPNDTQAETNTQKNGWYVDYSPESVAQAAAENKKVVIFFHAGWCPTCLTAAKDFQTNSDQIPSDVVILKADYDTATELKKKYNVVAQDTFVQIDTNGNQVAIWNSGGEGIASLLANLK